MIAVQQALRRAIAETAVSALEETMPKKKQPFIRPATRTILGGDGGAAIHHQHATTKAAQAAVSDHPITVEDMLPAERHAYEVLTGDYNEYTTISALLRDHLVDVAVEYAGELIDQDPYWTQVAPRQVWLDELKPLAEAAITEYLEGLDVQLALTSGKMDNPFTDSRFRTIAVTENTMARTCGAVLLDGLNNTMAALREGKDL